MYLYLDLAPIRRMTEMLSRCYGRDTRAFYIGCKGCNVPGFLPTRIYGHMMAPKQRQAVCWGKRQRVDPCLRVAPILSENAVVTTYS